MNDQTKPRVRMHEGTSGHAVVRLDDGLTIADVEAALADAGAWVEVPDTAGLPAGTVFRSVWRKGSYVTDHIYVHRDDLPPADPDAELVEKMARAMAKGDDEDSDEWGDLYPDRARAALAVVREHEARP